MNSNLVSSRLLERLGSGRLPVLPANTPMLLRALSSEELDFNEVAAVIEQFPTIAGRLIALANSAWSSPVEAILSVEQACARLGLSVVRSTSLALAVATAFDLGRCPEFDAERYWTDALCCAEAAARICSGSSRSLDLEPSAASAGGLLHSLGVLWIADRLPKEFGQAVQMRQAASAETSLHEVLFQVLGFDQGDAGGLLALKWQLPEDLELAMAMTGGYRPEQRRPMEWVVGYAARLVQSLHDADDCPADDPRVSLIGLQPEDCPEIQRALETEHERLRGLARALFA